MADLFKAACAYLLLIVLLGLWLTPIRRIAYLMPAAPRVGV